MLLNTNDDTGKLSRETFKYLQPDGKIHPAEDVIQAGTNSNLHQLALFPQSPLSNKLLRKHKLYGKPDTLSQLLHKRFGRFSFTLEPTEAANQYRVKT